MEFIVKVMYVHFKGKIDIHLYIVIVLSIMMLFRCFTLLYQRTEVASASPHFGVSGDSEQPFTTEVTLKDTVKKCFLQVTI